MGSVWQYVGHDVREDGLFLNNKVSPFIALGCRFELSKHS